MWYVEKLWLVVNLSIWILCFNFIMVKKILTEIFFLNISLHFQVARLIYVFFFHLSNTPSHYKRLNNAHSIQKDDSNFHDTLYKTIKQNIYSNSKTPKSYYFSKSFSFTLFFMLFDIKEKVIRKRELQINDYWHMHETIST